MKLLHTHHKNKRNARTQVLFLFVCFLFAAIPLQAQLSGTYTINPTGGDYTSINAAVTDLTTYGVSGSVTFNIAPGTYTGSIDIPAITGASDTSTITFAGANATTCIVEYNTSTQYSYVICLDGADYVRLENLTINATGATYGTGILLTNQADHNEITGCTINVPASGTGSNSVGICFSTKSSLGASGDHANYTRIEDNTIVGGYYGMHLYGNSSTTNCVGTQIVNNTVRDWYYYGIRCYYQGQLTVTGNTITRRASASTTTYGLYIRYCRGGQLVSGNYIQTVMYGIYEEYCNEDLTARGVIANNMIVADGTGANYGVHIISSYSFDVWYNSINLLSPTGTGYGLYMTGATTTAFDARNNTIKYNNGTGTFYAVYTSYLDAGSFTAMDYNNAYRAIGTTQYYIGSTYYDLSQLQTSFPGYNVHSKQVDPMYSSDTDLHTTTLGLNGAGVAIPSITTDFDGNIRDASTPDIGADEFVPPTLDIAITDINLPLNMCGLTATETIGVTLKNNAGVTFDAASTAVTVTIDVTGPVNQTLSGTLSTGTIASGATYVFAVNNGFNLSTPGLYTFSATAVLTGDQNSANDSYGPVSARADVTVTTYPYTEDFEANDGGWTAYLHGSSLINDWEWGAPNYTSTTEGTINTAHSGSSVWATTLDDQYSQNSEAVLVSPCFDLTTQTSPVLLFWMNYWSEIEWDGLIVEGSSDGGATWTKLTPVSPAYSCTVSYSALTPPFYSSETANSWQQYVFDLSQYAGQASTKVRFHYFSDEFTTGAGWAIDDVTVGEIPEKDIAVTDVRYNNASGFWARIVNKSHVIEAEIKNNGYESNPTSVTVVYKEGGIPADATDGIAETLTPVWNGVTGTVRFTTQHVPSTEGLTTLYVRVFYTNDAESTNDFASVMPNIRDSKTFGYEDFELLTPPDWETGWKIDNVNADETWEMTAASGESNSNGASYPGDIAPADDWLFSPGTELDDGSSYSLSFKYRSRTGTAQKLEVAYGTSPDPSSMTVFATFDGFTNTSFVDAVGTEGLAPFFNTGNSVETYYIGFHVTSDDNAGPLDLDQIWFYENPTPPPKIAYGISPNFTTDNTTPIVFSGVYKKTGLLSKTFTVTNATGVYGSPEGDMLWNVTTNDTWFSLTMSTPDPLTYLTSNPYSPEWCRQNQTFTIEIDASNMTPGTSTGSITIDAYLYNEDYPHGLHASNALFTVPVQLTLSAAGGVGQDEVVTRSGSNLESSGNPWIFQDDQGNTIATVWMTQGTIPSFTIRSYPSQLPEHISRYRYVQHYWEIDATGTGWTADIQFHYFDSEVLAGFVQDESQLVGMRIAPGTAFWENPILGTASRPNAGENYVFVEKINEKNYGGAIALAHSWTISNPEKNVNAEIPAQITLGQNFPNPFNPTTAITFGVPEEQHVTLSVRNALGEEVARLCDEVLPAGYHTIPFDASSLGSGFYVYTLTSGTETLTKTMILSK